MRRLLWTVVIGLSLAAPLSAATVDGLTIQSSTTGTGPATMIFIHGWTCDSSSWTGQVPAFAKKYRVVTLDLPGHGRSASPKDGKLSMDLFARAVEAVRVEAKADRVVLVGHSRAHRSSVSTRACIRSMWRVSSPLMDLSILRGFPPPEFKQPPPMVGPEGLKAREKMIRGMFIPQITPALQEYILKMMLGTSEATANGAMAAVFDPSLPKTDVIKAPALAVWAGTAKLPDPKVAKEVLPNYEGTQMLETGHFLMMEKPDEFNRVLTVVPRQDQVLKAEGQCRRTMGRGPISHWPAWQDTFATLHLWTQIVGKVRLAKTPWLNHSWHTTLYVTSRGLTTSPILNGTGRLNWSSISSHIAWTSNRATAGATRSH